MKYTGHERDLHRLSDYMRGRTCLYPLRRFASPDPGRDGWNLYAYTLNNPVRYVDPDGEIVETAWDVLNIGWGVASLAKNVKEGNVGGALLDAAGVVADTVAAVVPGAPGGAGSGIRALRAADAAGDTARVIARGGAAPVRAGQAGEAAVRAAHDIGEKTAVQIGEKTRIPDGINVDAKVLSEVKNVQRLSFTRQLRDLAQYAEQEGLVFNLYVRPGAKLSGPLLEAEAARKLNILEIPFP